MFIHKIEKNYNKNSKFTKKFTILNYSKIYTHTHTSFSYVFTNLEHVQDNLLNPITNAFTPNTFPPLHENLFNNNTLST